MKRSQTRARSASIGRGWRSRATLLAAILIAAALALSWLPSAASAQGTGRSREARIEKLTGKPFRVDTAGRARAATRQEAQQTVEQLEQLLPEVAAEPPVRDVAGVRTMHVDGLANRVVLGRPRGDGSFETRCVESLDEAVAFLSGELSAATDER